MNWLEIGSLAIAAYALASGAYLISENRRPQSTLAWIFVLFFLPGLGLLAYVLFGRPRKAFARQDKLQEQALETKTQPLLSSLAERQDSLIAELRQAGPTLGKLATLVKGNSHSVVSDRNSVEILQNASAFYPRLMRDMGEARHSIHLQYFIWGSDDFTDQLKAILVEKAREGVEVRLLYDPLGSYAHLDSDYIDEMRSAGVEVSPTAPLYRVHTISYRNHRKITVIDGAVGYTGGMNIGREHLSGGKGFDFWRDTQLRVVGPAASVLQSVFIVDWYNAVGEDISHPQYFPQPKPIDKSSGDVVQIVTSGPDSQWAAIRQMYFGMIVSARSHVFIQSPYFVLDATIAEALRSVALAGVDVKVMLSARASGDRLPEWAGNTFILDVLGAGVRVFLYEKGYLHAKTISVDSKVCSIGSANLDIRSFSINYELNAVLYSERLAGQLEADFWSDLEHCTEFDPAEYKRRNILFRFRDSVVRLASPLL